jgi:hypothetical protein
MCINMEVLLPRMEDVPPTEQDEGMVCRPASIYLVPIEIRNDVAGYWEGITKMV